MRRWLFILLILYAAAVALPGNDTSAAFVVPAPDTFLSQGAEQPSDAVSIPLFAVPVSLSSLHLCGGENLLARGKNSVVEFIALSRDEYLAGVRAAVCAQPCIVEGCEPRRPADRYVFALRKIII